MSIIKAFAGVSSTGESVYESLAVRRESQNTYELCASPGLISGFARGDRVRLNSHKELQLLQRGMNVSAQIYLDAPIFELKAECLSVLGNVDGYLDGLASKQMVVSFPVSIGFKKIEDCIAQLLRLSGSSIWNYGNIYDEADGRTPLNWWQSLE